MPASLSLIVATKDRPADLRRLLESLSAQTVRPSQVVVVDSSAEPVELVVAAFPALNPVYLRHWPPSAAAQRNAGVKACAESASLIGFVDDDAAFEPAAIERMLAFWEAAGPDVLGASFNIRNYSLPGGQRLKRSRLVRWLGLYAPEPGRVAPSGWQTVMEEFRETQFVDWLPSTAVVWRAEVLRRSAFDEFFDGYSYLEDLDFSYAIGRGGRLAVVADAGYFHFPATGGRLTLRQFGRIEVRNRLYFVRKHGLSVPRCCLAIAVRLTADILGGVVRLDPRPLARALGNVESIVASSAKIPSPRSSHAGC